MRIILDTNFLINCAKFHIDYCEQLRHHQIYTLDAVIAELEKLIKQKKASHARLALQILKQKKIKIIKTRKEADVDSKLIYFAGAERYAIATADKDLKNKLKGKKIFIIRQKKYIREIK